MSERQQKWLNSMVKKYGSKAAVKEEMRRRQLKSRETYDGSKRGFYKLKQEDPERLSKLSKEAANKRWNNT